MSDTHVTPQGELNRETIQTYVVDSCGGDRELVLEMVQFYLNSADTLLLEMEEGLASQDFEIIRRAAHSLKSSSRMFSAETLASYCQSVEDETETSANPQVDEYLSAMRAQVAWLHQALPVTCREMMG